MAPIFKLHKMVYNLDNATKTRYFLCNPTTYQGLKTETGIDVADESEANEVRSDVEDLLGSGEIIRIKMGYKVGTKIKYAHLILPVTRVLGFKKSMLGKQYKGGTVVSIRGRRVASYY